MRNLLLLITAIIASQAVLGQTDLQVWSDAGADTINICPKQVVEFYGKTTYNASEVTGDYTWQFDDGTVFSGLGVDTVRYSFQQPGVHRILVTSEYNGDKAYSGIIVLVGNPPIFEGTKVVYEGNEKGVCKGDEITLQAVIHPNPYKEERTTVYNEPFAFEVNNSSSYQNSIVRRSFAYDRTYTSGDLDSVGLKLIHSNSSQVKITLTAPDGQTIILKDYGGNANTFGNPAQGTDGAQWYYWKNSSANGTINSLAIDGSEIPPTSYQSDETFDDLSPSHLNGNWTITVSDNTAGENGYILAWALYFDTAAETDSINYTNTYDFEHAFWDGDNINPTSNGMATANPEEYGGHQYIFYIKDNWQCFHDTAVIAQVEEAHFEVDKNTLDIGDSLQVDDQTSWAVNWSWDFGDATSENGEKSFYHKYFDKGIYTITLTAYSKSGCTDTDTAQITVNPRPIQLPDYNVFTPNGDGVNDVFSFFNKPDDKITAANIETINGKIYDRNGKVVCQWSSPDQAIEGWDGTYMNNGKHVLPEGVYYYVIIIKGKDGKDYEPFTGYIYLRR